MAAYPIQQNETNYLIAFDTINRNYIGNDTISTGSGWTGLAPQLNDPSRTLSLFPENYDNTTNDVTIDLHTTPQRLPAVSLSVGSLEIPSTQTTIERLWNQFYFSEFYEPLPSGSQAVSSSSLSANGGSGDMDMNMNSLQLQWTTKDGISDHYTATLPMLQNPIVSVEPFNVGADTISARLTTRYPHSLVLADNYDWATATAGGATAGGTTTSGAGASSSSTIASNESQATSWIRLIGTPLPLTATTLNSANAHLKLIDDFTFELTGVPTLTPATLVTQLTTATNLGSFGYVYAPPIPGPYQLTKLVTAAIQVHPLLETNQVSLIFLPKLHQVRFQFTPIKSPTLVTSGGASSAFVGSINTQNTSTKTVANPLILSSANSNLVDSADSAAERVEVISIVNSIPSVDSLALQLGFPDSLTIHERVPQRTSISYLHFSMLKLDPGNYQGQTLAPQLDLQWNRLYFEKPVPPAGAPPVDYTQKFAFSDSSGTVHVISIPFGMYTPRTFALFLQQQMNALAAAGTTYTVTFAIDTFTFSSNSTTPGATAPVFGLELATAASQSPQLVSISTGSPYPTVAQRLGFQTLNYRGKAVYVSPIQAYVPQASAFSSSLAKSPYTSISTDAGGASANGIFAINNRGLSFLWIPSYSSTTNKFTFNLSLPRPNVGTITGSAPTVDGENAIVTLVFPEAHGFQPLQPLHLQFTGLGAGTQVFDAVVLTVPDAFTVTIDPGTQSNVPVTINGGAIVPSWIALASAPISAQLAYTPTGNMFMAPMYSSATSTADGASQPVSSAVPNFNQLPSAMLGFPDQDFIWTGTQAPDVGTQSLLTAPFNTTFPQLRIARTTLIAAAFFDSPNLGSERSLFPLTSPQTVELEGPQYLLLQIIDPQVTTHFQHRYKQDLKTNLLAKILLHNQSCHKIERFLHVQGLLGGAYSRLVSVRLRLLNPDHTLYQLHNKNWSGTLSVTALQDRIQLLK